MNDAPITETPTAAAPDLAFAEKLRALKSEAQDDRVDQLIELLAVEFGG